MDHQHDALLTTCEDALISHSPSESVQTGEQPAPTVLVFYTHHRPHLAHRDLEFFTKARERRWVCVEIVEEKFPVRHDLHTCGYFCWHPLAVFRLLGY